MNRDIRIALAAFLLAWSMMEVVFGCPVAVVSGDDEVCIDCVLSLSASSSYDTDEGGLSIEDYEWELPLEAYDITGEYSEYMSCKFSSAGPYWIMLRVEDDESDWSDWEYHRVYVVEVEDVTCPVGSTCVDTGATFTVVTDPSGHYEDIQWSGGGIPATQNGGETFATQWDTTGVKSVTATCGSSSDSKSITIKGMGSVNADKSEVCEGEDVTFTGTTSPPGNEGSISWSGGGTPSTGSGATFVTKWTTGGSGNRTVTATYCGDSKNKSVNVLTGCDCDRPGDWQTISGLSVCNYSSGPEGDCWPSSDPPKYDDCGNWGKVVCTNAGSGYEYRDYYNSTGTCMGACVYLPAWNRAKYRFTVNGDRWHSFKHVTLNDCNDSGSGDMGTAGKYDWQIWRYDCISETLEEAECLESSTIGDPISMEWLEQNGSASDCERESPCP
jgi:hypothetical protein